MRTELTSNEETAAQKKALRAEMKKRLKALTLDITAASEALYQNLCRLDEFRKARTIGLYVDFQQETPTRLILAWLFEDKSLKVEKVAVPYCVGKEMRFYQLSRPSVNAANEVAFEDLTETPPFGILEPDEKRRNDPKRRVEPSSIDALIVPGLAFDRQGGRLGRGAGYYDRYLPMLRPDALTIGYCYDEQIVDQTPTESNDFPVGALVTPSEAIRFTRRASENQ